MQRIKESHPTRQRAQKRRQAGRQRLRGGRIAMSVSSCRPVAGQVTQLGEKKKCKYCNIDVGQSAIDKALIDCSTSRIAAYLSVKAFPAFFQADLFVRL